MKEDDKVIFSYPGTDADGESNAIDAAPRRAAKAGEGEVGGDGTGGNGVNVGIGKGGGTGEGGAREGGAKANSGKVVPFKRQDRATRRAPSRLFSDTDSGAGAGTGFGPGTGFGLETGLGTGLGFGDAAASPENSSKGALYGVLSDEAGRSSDYSDVARRVLELSKTVKEAISHLISKLDTFETDRAADMLKIICEGIDGISKAATALDKGLRENQPGETDAEIMGRLESMVDAYIEKRFGDLAPQSAAFKTAYEDYDKSLSHRFRHITVN